jgi:hypothetical protein
VKALGDESIDWMVRIDVDILERVSTTTLQRQSHHHHVCKH